MQEVSWSREQLLGGFVCYLTCAVPLFSSSCPGFLTYNIAAAAVRKVLAVPLNTYHLKHDVEKAENSTEGQEPSVDEVSPRQSMLLF